MNPSARVSPAGRVSARIPVSQLPRTGCAKVILARVSTLETRGDSQLARVLLRDGNLRRVRTRRHVADPEAFLQACRKLLRPGGMLVCATLNRTPKSYFLAVFGAERVMRWLPPGTHDWSKFITPGDLAAMLARADLTPFDRSGFVFDPIGWSWSISARDLSENYVITSVSAA